MQYNRQELNNKQVISFLIDSKFRLLRHTFFILGLLFLLYSSTFPYEYAGNYKYYSLITVFVSFLVMFYVNMYFLVPFFFLRARYALYILLLVVLVVAGLFFIAIIASNYLEPHRIMIRTTAESKQGFYGGIIISIPIILMTTTIKLLQRWIIDNKRISELRDLTLRMELNELKNQINPHFLFNMLNNVKALTRSDPEKASMVIVKLSEFLRYQLYENNETLTSLPSEMHFIANFLNLEKIRRDDFTFTIFSTIEQKEFQNIVIPPNLFTVFIENAVKHSVDISGKPTFITIEIALISNKLHFKCINSRSADAIAYDEKYSGLGLVNTKRRLELLYQEKYELYITSHDLEYIVNLNIPI